MEHTIQLGLDNPYLDEKKQQAIQSLLEEHLGVGVKLKITPASEEFQTSEQGEAPYPYFLTCRFKSDIPPTEDFFINRLVDPLMKIINKAGDFGYNLSFGDPSPDEIADNCFKIKKIGGNPFDEQERNAFAAALRAVTPNIIVKFHQSSDLICEGMDLDAFNDKYNERPSPGAPTLRETLNGIVRRTYPDEELSYEVVAKNELGGKFR
jgi:hypothetical protein